MKHARNPYLDFLKGIAIVMVVFIHTTPKMDILSTELSDLALLLFRQIINVAVPLFIAISGFLCGYKKRTPIENKSFVIKQLRSLYIPCLLWSIPYFILDLMHGQNIFCGVLLFLFCGYSIYYFILLILQYYTLSSVIQKISYRGRLSENLIISSSRGNSHEASLY